MGETRPLIRELVATAAERLRAAGSESARIDADVLMMLALGVDRTGLYLAYPEPAAPDLASRFTALVGRRVTGEPIAYIRGSQEFMGLEFAVDPRVLIPRPETEGLVEWALKRLRARPTTGPVVDVGTGSGAIAISLAHHLTAEQLAAPLVIGSDRSIDAIRVAGANARRLASDRVRLVVGDLLSWARPGLGLILANLPYLRPDQAHAGIAREPSVALFAPGDGFALYQELLTQAVDRLRADGAIGCEIDPDQRQVALTEAERRFPGATVEVWPDLAGLDRYLIIDRLKG